MNRLFKRNIYLTILGLIILTGCDRYLEENPDNRVELNTTEKAAQLLTNAYSNAGYTFTEWMSDNVSYTLGTGKLPEHNQSFEWKEVTGINQDTPTNFWTSTYDAIAHANEVLAVIDQLPGERERKDAVKGEALLARAYGHFMLVNIFAQHYDESTAKKDLGIPYVEEPERVFIKKYERNTVEEVYDKIEEDLLAGLKLVNGSFYANSGKYHFTKNAALAFASRFYLFKRDYVNCIKYSSEMLGTNPNTFVKDLPALLAETINTEDFIRGFHSPNDDSNLLLIRQITNFHIPSLGHWPSSDFYQALFTTHPFTGFTDERRDPAWVAGEGIAASKYEFLFERSSITSNVGLNYTIFLGFRGEEVLMNRIECYAYRNQFNLAIADLQLLVAKRYINDDGDVPVISLPLLRTFFGSNSDQDNILNYVLFERRKEFLHEGLRWFDIKRYENIVKHTLENGSSITLQANDKRKAIQIPQAAIDVGGLKPNPR